MGLVGVQGDGNGEMTLFLGSKNKYKRMDSELSDDFEDDASHHHHQLERNKSTRKYVLACAIFASLNNVLLGYGKFFFLHLSTMCFLAMVSFFFSLFISLLEL